MTLHAVRIVKARHAATAFSGEGARRFGGRWNTPGSALVYTAGSAALAILEMLVHLNAHELMNRYVLFDVSFDDSIVTTIDSAKLPKSWRKSPPPVSVQYTGDAWIAAGTSAVLRVPSTIVPAESNYLLNPAHLDFSSIKIGPRQPIRFDPRLVKTPVSPASP
jgi:RES domain-containing protein